MWRNAGHFNCSGSGIEAHLLNSRPINLSQESYDKRLFACARRAVEQKMRTVARRHLQQMALLSKATVLYLHRTAVMHLEAMDEDSVL